MEIESRRDQDHLRQLENAAASGELRLNHFLKHNFGMTREDIDLAQGLKVTENKDAVLVVDLGFCRNTQEDLAGDGNLDECQRQRMSGEAMETCQAEREAAEQALSAELSSFKARLAAAETKHAEDVARALSEKRQRDCEILALQTELDELKEEKVFDLTELAAMFWLLNTGIILLFQTTVEYMST